MHFPGPANGRICEPTIQGEDEGTVDVVVSLQQSLLTKQGNRKLPFRQDVLTWVSRSWQGIPEEVIRQSFILCGITADINGGQDRQMFSHVPQVLVEEVEEEEEDGEDENESPDSFVEGDDFDPFGDL